MTEPNLIERAIIAHWGDRCSEYAAGCGACEAWKEYDAMTEQNQSPVVTDEELIAACKAHDKEEAAQMGEPSPWEVNKDDIDPEWVSSRVAAMRCAMAALPSGVRVNIPAARKGWEVGRNSWCPAGILADSERTEQEWAGALPEILSAIEPTQAPQPSLDEKVRLAVERFNSISPEEQAAHRAEQAKSFARGMAPCEHGVADWEGCADCRKAAPAPAELEQFMPRFSTSVGPVMMSLKTGVRLSDDGPWVRLTEAQAAIAALRAERERLDEECRQSMTTIAQERERAEAAETRVAELEKALKPFAFLADCSEREPVGASVMVNVERCRDARSALHPEREG